MTKHYLSAEPRTLLGRGVKKLRTQGLLPASLFGKKVASLNLQLNAKEFQKLHSEVGESSLMYLKVGSESAEHPVLIREILFHPVSGNMLHVSFQEVSLKEKVTVPVPLELEGEAQAVSQKLGIMVQQLSEVELEALPTDIPENIKVDVSGLSEIDASITVADLKLNPDKFTVATPGETVIVKIEPLAAEEVEEAPAPVEGEEGATPAEGEAEGEAPAAQTGESKEEASE